MNKKYAIHVGVLLLAICVLLGSNILASQVDATVKEYIQNGISYGKKQDYSAAVTEFNKAIKLDPRSSKAYFNLGVVYELMQQYDPAIASYEQAIALKPDYAKAYYNLAPLYGINQDFPKVIETYQKALRLAPQLASDKTYVNLSGTYFYAGNLEQAKKMALKATEINPKSGQGHFQLGIVYLYMGDTKQARAQCRVLKRLREKALAKKLFKEIERVSF